MADRAGANRATSARGRQHSRRNGTAGNRPGGHAPTSDSCPRAPAQGWPGRSTHRYRKQPCVHCVSDAANPLHEQRDRMEESFGGDAWRSCVTTALCDFQHLDRSCGPCFPGHDHKYWRGQAAPDDRRGRSCARPYRVHVIPALNRGRWPQRLRIKLLDFSRGGRHHGIRRRIRHGPIR
jgi:hypothetical protein